MVVILEKRVINKVNYKELISIYGFSFIRFTFGSTPKSFASYKMDFEKAKIYLNKLL